MTRVYIAGPMSGIPQFNFPLFVEVAKRLRERNIDVVSPVDLDTELGIDKEALSSTDGDASKISKTWGDLLSRDVKLIADGGISGIVFLPDWYKSRGARLEAFVGLQKSESFFFHEWIGSEFEDTRPMPRRRVLQLLDAFTP